MFRFEKRLQRVAAAAAAVAALASAAPAGAVTLLSASMNTSNTAIITGPAYPHGVDVYDAPVTFHAIDDGTPIDFLAYCIDIYHDMYLGPLNGGAGYAYHPEALTTDSKDSTSTAQLGDALSVTQLDKIGALVNYSAFLVSHPDANLANQLSAIQAAIWVVENNFSAGPHYTVSSNNGLNPLITQYVNDAAVAPYMPTGQTHTIFANDYGHQAFIIAGGIPEPATWGLMIVGFGGVGAMLRQRRRLVAALT